LEKNGHLIRIKEEVDPNLEMAEIHRLVFEAGGPAIFFEKVKGSPFPAVSNLYGTIERARFIFRHTLKNVKSLVAFKADPKKFLKNPLGLFSLPFAAMTALPRKVCKATILENETTMDQLPQIKSWPDDGGPFILLPQVYTENQDHANIFQSNLGMYRIQMAGNEYKSNQEIGLHYQIRRDIGIHHRTAMKRGEPLRVSIFVGGPPAHAFASVMYLPEGLPEVAFAGALAGRGFRFARNGKAVISADADFCITGYVEVGKTKPEGPFGDHLGYYSLQHEFPYLKVEKVYHRKDAIWPFTIVGRPPQEDSVFGKLIQEIAGPILPKEIPGVKAVQAVDASGVHPLMLAIGSERYMPYRERQPQEILVQANAILGYGPCSLSKYLMILADDDVPNLDIHDTEAFFCELLKRVDWTRDLHFQTRTSMDTLDYSGTAINEGSKVVFAAAGSVKRNLTKDIPNDLDLPEGFENPKISLPGVLLIQGPAFSNYQVASKQMELFSQKIGPRDDLDELPLIVVVDDADFSAKDLKSFLWVTFTRSNPSHDIYGVESFQEFKHWGCRGSLIIDARIKPHHAPPLIEDPKVTQRVRDKFASPGQILHGIV
jgi:4-hydroxy-3-polyprenylbenzoate decarboxylase